MRVYTVHTLVALLLLITVSDHMTAHFLKYNFPKYIYIFVFYLLNCFKMISTQSLE